MQAAPPCVPLGQTLPDAALPLDFSPSPTPFPTLLTARALSNKSHLHFILAQQKGSFISPVMRCSTHKRLIKGI